MGKRHLVILTKYPTPGKVKTRLTSSLSVEQAALIHRHLTEYTLIWAQRLLVKHKIRITVSYSGAFKNTMIRWLGSRLSYEQQPDGNLGIRLAHATQLRFAQGGKQVLVIGADCPDLDESIALDAFDRLSKHNAVLGPAEDGGYYLLGLNAFHPEVFKDISWSTDKVFDQTIQKFKKIGWTSSTLPQLSDVDQPMDLLNWNYAKIKKYPKLSIIIPTVNEAKNLPKTLTSVAQSAHSEIIVSDGGSSDATPQIATKMGAHVCEAPKGRASQMNAGAHLASGHHLLFLHADTTLPIHFDYLIRSALIHPKISGGSFELGIDASHWYFRAIEGAVSLRTRLLKLPFSDQGIFLNKSLFDSIQGFPQIPILEDAALMRILNRHGKICTLPYKVLTSPRRWQQLGFLRTTRLFWMCAAGFYLKLPPKKIAAWYRAGLNSHKN